jgi:hypothetical protein
MNSVPASLTLGLLLGSLILAPLPPLPSPTASVAWEAGQDRAIILTVDDAEVVFQRIVAQLPEWPERKDYAVQIVHAEGRALSPGMTELLRRLNQAQIRVESYGGKPGESEAELTWAMDLLPGDEVIDKFYAEYRAATGDEVPIWQRIQMKQSLSKAQATGRLKRYLHRLFELGEGWSWIRPLKRRDAAGREVRAYRPNWREGVVNGTLATAFFAPIVWARGNAISSARFLAANSYMFAFVTAMVAFQPHVNAVRGQGVRPRWDDSQPEGEKVRFDSNPALFTAVTIPIELVHNHLLFLLVVAPTLMTWGEYGNQWVNALACTYSIVPIMMLVKLIEDAALKNQDTNPRAANFYRWCAAAVSTFWWSVIFPNLSNAEQFLLPVFRDRYSWAAGIGFLLFGTAGIGLKVWRARRAIYLNIKSLAQAFRKQTTQSYCSDYVRVTRLPRSPVGESLAVIAE